MSEEPRFAPNGNRLPERLPIGHRLVDTTKQQWLIGPSIGCGGFGDIYLTRQYNQDKDDLKRLTREQIIRESSSWTNVIKFEHFSGPLFAEINFYLRCARKETVEEYMSAKKLKRLGMPRFVASGIYDPLRDDNPGPVCKDTISSSAIPNGKPPAAKRGRKSAPAANGNGKAKANGPVVANGKQKRIPASQTKEKKYRFLVLQRFGDDIHKIWCRAKERFDMKSAFNIALKVIDTLEYIHSHGYVHADVKASNLLIERCDDHSKSENNGIIKNSINDKSEIQSNGIVKKERNPRNFTKPIAVKRSRPKSLAAEPTTNGNGVANGTLIDGKNSIEPEDEIYLVDFGLVERFLGKDGLHRDHVEDQRRANNGTVEFSSRDAHIGAFSRRSDLESLGYNLLYWVSGGRLPWLNVRKDHQLVETSKKWYMDNLEVFVNYCFNEKAEPIDPLKIIKGLSSSADPSAHSSKSSSTSNQYHQTNGRTNGRSSKNNIHNNNAPTVSTTSTKASTTTLNSKQSSTSRTPKSKKQLTSSSSSSTTNRTSTSSIHDSIMCTALYDFLSYITKLNFADEPDYYLLKSILINALGGGSSTRTARKRGSSSLKKTPPKLPKCENPTPAMREVLEKLKLSSKKW